MECVKVTAGVRKLKKKPVKDEFDRIKQAEKKKRRLEKALATSAAIRLELEKKKLKKKEELERLGVKSADLAELDRIKQAENKNQCLEKALATSATIRSELEKKMMKKNEQERLDEESAAIAEAVALQVLLGEDSDDSNKMDEGLTYGDHASNISFIMRKRQPPVHSYNLSKYSCENIGGIPDAHQNDRMWNYWGNYNSMASADCFCPQYFGEEYWRPVGLSIGHLAAQAVSSLKIADDAWVGPLVFNRIVRG